MKTLKLVLALVVTVTGVFFAQASSPTVPDANAHENGYLGLRCQYGYPGTLYGFAWKDCLKRQVDGDWFVSDSGYWYHYIWGEYRHSWWGIPQGTSWRVQGHCWASNDCVWY